MFEISRYNYEGHNLDIINEKILSLTTPETKTKVLKEWQEECLNTAIKDNKLVRFLSIHAFCGSGKSLLQVALAIFDIISTNYTQKQLITVPQEHIHHGFVGEDDLYIYQNGIEYFWQILPEHNFCSGVKRVAGLKKWLLTQPEILAKKSTANYISGLNAICGHSALARVWKSLTDAEKAQAVKNLTLRIDEAHHIKHVFSENQEGFSEKELELVKQRSNNLGRICTYLINTKDDSPKIHQGTGTPYRGDTNPMYFKQARKNFVEYNLDWLKHFKTLGIKSFYLQYEEYDEDPIDQIIEKIKNEPLEKHYVVIPSRTHKWRKCDTDLNLLLNGLREFCDPNRILDLVESGPQKDNKALLLSEPKYFDESNSSKYDIVIVCMLGREGTDWCPCSRVHNASIGDSVTMMMQTIGRPFRQYTPKKVVKIYNYVKKFIKPNEVTKRELLSDISNALLIRMQLDDQNNPITIPSLKHIKPITLIDIFGGDIINIETCLINEYEVLETKSKENIYAIAERICDEYEITEDKEVVKDALVARILRTVSKNINPDQINVAWLREEGNFDKLELYGSVYFGEYTVEDFRTIRGVLLDRRSEDKARKEFKKIVEKYITPDNLPSKEDENEERRKHAEWIIRMRGNKAKNKYWFPILDKDAVQYNWNNIFDNRTLIRVINIFTRYKGRKLPTMKKGTPADRKNAKFIYRLRERLLKPQEAERSKIFHALAAEYKFPDAFKPVVHKERTLQRAREVFARIKQKRINNKKYPQSIKNSKDDPDKIQESKDCMFITMHQQAKLGGAVTNKWYPELDEIAAEYELAGIFPNKRKTQDEIRLDNVIELFEFIKENKGEWPKFGSDKDTYEYKMYLRMKNWRGAKNKASKTKWDDRFQELAVKYEHPTIFDKQS